MLVCAGLERSMGGNRVLDGTELTVGHEEIVAVLGPSGSGKSTLLRAIAGLEPLDAGTVTWDGEDITDMPVHERDFGLVFQSYALFPHRTVAQNVGFGLKVRGANPTEVDTRVEEALRRVGLAGFGDRRIQGLSGGEQQRVAVARTMITGPRLVMLDEPLGALDRQLRARLLDDTHRLLRETHSAAIYVTHDHEEAQQVADRLALMRAGRIVQTGTAVEIARDPVEPWVADFMGGDVGNEPRPEGEVRTGSGDR